MTAEHACTRKQFNRNLSEFGLIQVRRGQGLGGQSPSWRGFGAKARSVAWQAWVSAQQVCLDCSSEHSRRSLP